MSRRGGDRRLAAVLFTDIVSSTEVASEMGDARWLALLGRHHRIVRAHLKLYGGHEQDTAGDGFFATFDVPADAVRCAVAAQREVREPRDRDPRRRELRRGRDGRREARRPRGPHRGSHHERVLGRRRDRVVVGEGALGRRRHRVRGRGDASPQGSRRGRTPLPCDADRRRSGGASGDRREPRPGPDGTTSWTRARPGVAGRSSWAASSVRRCWWACSRSRSVATMARRRPRADRTAVQRARRPGSDDRRSGSGDPDRGATPDPVLPAGGGRRGGRVAGPRREPAARRS